MSKAELEAARRALNAELKKRHVGQVLTAQTKFYSDALLYQATAHALCYRLQFAGASHDDLCALLRGVTVQQFASLRIGAKAQARLEKSLGLVRTTDQERRKTNELLARIYRVTDDVPTDIVRDIFVKFLLTHCVKVGITRELAITRIENLDALQRFAGPPCRYVPEHQYGL